MFDRYCWMKGCLFSILLVQSAIAVDVDCNNEALSRSSQAAGFQPQSVGWREAPQSAAGETAWYIILGSFPQTAMGMADANQRADELFQGLGTSNLVVSETVFYEGLTPGLYVVMAGPYSSANKANHALIDGGFQTMVRDAYVKRVFERPLD